MNKLCLCIAPLAALVGCAEFPEKYENVVPGGKIRPFAIVLDPPEAAPGDTVKVALKLYDADKSYSVGWEMALKGQLGLGGGVGAPFTSASEVVDLDSGAVKIGASPDGLSFSVVIPSDDKNPLQLTTMSPEILKPESGITAEEKAALAELGVVSFQGGLRKSDLVEALDKADSVPNVLAPLVDGLIGLVQFKAKVVSQGFTLDVNKFLTVRYSNRLDSGAYLSNVNRNPLIDSIGFIRVNAKGLTHFDEIAGHESDTVFFTTRPENDLDSPSYDTLDVVEGWSYFLIARSEGSEQDYRSPLEEVHKEQLFYQWFYSNLDPTGTDWEDLITLANEDRPANFPVVPIRFPKADVGLRHFSIKATVGDSRPEWGALSATGLDYKMVYGYLKYE